MEVARLKTLLVVVVAGAAAEIEDQAEARVVITKMIPMVFL